MDFFYQEKQNSSYGFALIELLMVIAILTVMTSIILFKSSRFNGSVLLENLAYEIALTARQAQFFGMNVRSASISGSSTFETGYGVYFNRLQSTSFVLFADADRDGLYNGDDVQVDSFTIIGGNEIKNLCVDDNCSGFDKLFVSFRRPNPDAYVKTDNNSLCGGQNPDSGCGNAKIYIGSSQESIPQRVITITSTGQISIANVSN